MFSIPCHTISWQILGGGVALPATPQIRVCLKILSKGYGLQLGRWTVRVDWMLIELMYS